MILMLCYFSIDDIFVLLKNEYVIMLSEKGLKFIVCLKGIIVYSDIIYL